MRDRVSGAWTWRVSTGQGARLLQVFHRGKALLWHPEGPPPEAWCVGGERTWITPEYGDGGFFLDPDTGEERVPKELDPGSYRLIEEDGDRFLFSSPCSLRSRGGSPFRLVLGREIRLIGGDAAEIAFRITSTLENAGRTGFPYPIGLWEVVQLPALPGAFCRMKTRGPAEARDCLAGGTFHPAKEESGCLRVPSLETREAKAGLGAEAAEGVLSYQGGGYRVEFRTEEPPDPRAVYADRPGRREDEPGDAVQVYTTGPGRADPFCELELHSPARALDGGASMTFCVILKCSLDEGTVCTD